MNPHLGEWLLALATTLNLNSDQPGSGPQTVYLTDPAATTWHIPADYDSGLYTQIEVIGGGSGGGTTHYTDPIYADSGCGGGYSGVYGKIPLTIGANVPIQVGAAGSVPYGAGGTSSFSNGTTVQASATGGGAGPACAGGAPVVGTGFTGGHSGGQNQAAYTTSGAGGAAGPLGPGGNGGDFAKLPGNNGGGSGGGGNGGGADGASSQDIYGNPGGNNALGYGGGSVLLSYANAQPGVDGGGGGGGDSHGDLAGAGGNGIDLGNGYGSGGGAGGGPSTGNAGRIVNGAAGGCYGGGGGGVGYVYSLTPGSGGAGCKGLIKIQYNLSLPHPLISDIAPIGWDNRPITTFYPPAGSDYQLGTIRVSTTFQRFGGTLALSQNVGGCNSANGADNASFALVGSSLWLKASATQGPKAVCIAATQGGKGADVYNNSPFSKALTITGVSPSIASISLYGSPAGFSDNNFTAGAASGTLIGGIRVTMDSKFVPLFKGTVALGTGSGCPGTDNAHFQVVGPAPYSLKTNNVLGSGTYSISLVATQTGISPKCQNLTIVGNPQTVDSISVVGSTFPGGAADGTVIGPLKVVLTPFGSNTRLTPALSVFNGTLATSTSAGGCNTTNGAGNSHFRIESVDGVPTLKANGTLGGSGTTYRICIVATPTDGAVHGQPLTLTSFTTTPSTAVGIASIRFINNQALGGPGTNGETIGTLGAIMNPASTGPHCVWSISGSSFAVDSSTGVVTAVRDLTIGTTYPFTATCTQTGAAMSPFSYDFSVTAVAPTDPAVFVSNGSVFHPGDIVNIQVRNAQAATDTVDFVWVKGHEGSLVATVYLYGAKDGVGNPTGVTVGATGIVNLTLHAPNLLDDPDDSYIHHFYLELEKATGYTRYALTGWLDTIPTYDHVVPTAASPSFADPFVPKYTLTVCPSGCDYATIGEATANAQDYTLIIVHAIPKGFYKGCANIYGSDELNSPSHGNPGQVNVLTHIWLKGVSHDGDLVEWQGWPPWVGCTMRGSSDAGRGVVYIGSGTTDPIDVTVENFEIADCGDDSSSAGCVYLSWGNSSDLTIRLRNVYVHDAEEDLFFAGENWNAHFILENSVFSRGGHNASGWQHNMYIGGCPFGQDCSLRMENSISKETCCGHEVKTRATYSTVNCSLVKEAYWPFGANQGAPNYNSSGSAAIDFSEGRVAILHNSTIAMGPFSYNQNNAYVRYSMDAWYETPAKKYFDLQGNLFINDGPADVGYVDYGPTASTIAARGIIQSTIPPSNSTGNVWVGSSGYAGGPPVTPEMAPAGLQSLPRWPLWLMNPIRPSNTWIQGGGYGYKVVDNPDYGFIPVPGWQMTGATEPPAFACPGACPTPGELTPGGRLAPTRILDGTENWYTTSLPQVPLPGSLTETIYATRTAAAAGGVPIGASDFPTPHARTPRSCPAPTGNVVVPPS